MSEHTANNRPRWFKVTRYAFLGTCLVALIAIAGARNWFSDPAPPERTIVSQASAAESGEDGEHKYTNHLADENSPYLQMHAHNPVNWYPWGDKAFEKAKKEDKPIFLSVGYSTCYWCQVMERESFVDPDVAEIINEHYVAVKVDRERRPAIDQKYMTATRMITGRGGWPNSVWLTPDGKPWMAGTYFPRERFMQTLKRLNKAWENQRQKVNQQADRLAHAIQQRSGNMVKQAGTKPVNREMVDNALSQYASQFDSTNGGFGGAPKFPPHGTLRFMMAEQQRKSTDQLRNQLTRTLDAMWLGGMHDHVGGGFHRYSTDGEWKLPHFEKMLYDNAQQIHNFAQGHALFGKERYRQAVADTYRWLERKMKGEHGGFYSAIDAEVDGHEGKTYVWHYDEILDVLGEEDGQFFAEIYNVNENGNYREEASGEKPGTNVLHLDRPLARIADDRGMEAEALRDKLNEMHQQLLKRRLQWKQPEIDDKIVAGWNGLMIEALAYAGRKLDEPRYIERAERAANFILNYMVQDGRLMRIYRDGKLSQLGYLDDHAYLAAGFLELYRATGHLRWLNKAKWLADDMLTRFQDTEDGGFYYTTKQHEQAFGNRTKNLTSGGNTPTPNGTAARVLLRLGRMTDTPKYTKAANETLTSLSGIMWQAPQSVDALLLAASVKLAPGEPVDIPDSPKATKVSADGKDTAETAADNSGQPPVTGEADVTKAGSPVGIRVFGPDKPVAPGEQATVYVALDIDEGWHLYGKNPKIDFLVPTHVTLSSESEELAVGQVKRPEPTRKKDPVLEKTVNTYSGTIWFEIPITLTDEQTQSPLNLTVDARIQACDERRCLPPRTESLEFSIERGRK
jgi:uncharacterized protein YyaL (SSP411 family)